MKLIRFLDWLFMFQAEREMLETLRSHRETGVPKYID